MAVYSTQFAKYYDLFTGDHASIIKSVMSLIYQTQYKKNLSILELACGTGTILKLFPKQYTLHGLDIAPSMVALAKKKVPNAKIVVGDMTNFSFPTKFDVILCVFDSINHLTKFSQWERVFRLSAKHLDSNGTFIFDVNTPKRLQTLATFKPYVAKLNKNTIAIAKITKERNIYPLRISILERINASDIGLIEESIEETAFDIQKIKNSLEKYFIIVKTLDPFRKHISKNTGRVFFACRKK